MACSDEHSGEPRPAARKRPRRATAPPTSGDVDAGTDRAASATPDADWLRWWSRDESAAQARSAQDQWYLDQRPPHWG